MVGCDHNCTNTAGSYFCTCTDGYELELDNHTCTGDDYNQLGTKFIVYSESNKPYSFSAQYLYGKIFVKPTRASSMYVIVRTYWQNLAYIVKMSTIIFCN